MNIVFWEGSMVSIGQRLLLCCKSGQEGGTAHYVRWIGVVRIAEAVVPDAEKEAGKPHAAIYLTG